MSITLLSYTLSIYYEVYATIWGNVRPVPNKTRLSHIQIETRSTFVHRLQ